MPRQDVQGGVRRGRRGGMTLVEAVLAAALLGIFASVLLAAVNGAWREQLRHRQMIGAAELANRLVIIFLDDRTELPSPMRPLAYGPPENPFLYRWERIDSLITIEDPPGLSAEAARFRREQRRSPRAEERFRAVTFRVWLSEDDPSGRGAFRPTESTPQAMITRMLDPVYPRNPDSVGKLLTNPQLQEQIYGGLLGGGPAPMTTPRERGPR